MAKFKFNANDAEQVSIALQKVQNSTLNEISAEFIHGAAAEPCCCSCSWSKSQHSKSGDAFIPDSL